MSLATYRAKRAGSSVVTSSRGRRLGAAEAMEAKAAAIARREEKGNCMLNGWRKGGLGVGSGVGIDGLEWSEENGLTRAPLYNFTARE